MILDADGARSGSEPSVHGKTFVQKSKLLVKHKGSQGNIIRAARNVAG